MCLSVFFQKVNSFCSFVLVNELTAPRNVLQLLIANVSIPVEVWKKRDRDEPCHPPTTPFFW